MPLFLAHRKSDRIHDQEGRKTAKGARDARVLGWVQMRETKRVVLDDRRRVDDWN
jgi:hypothetical protein